MADENILSEDAPIETPAEQEQGESTLVIAIESDEFVPVSEGELEYTLTIAAVDTRMSTEQDRIRSLIIDQFPQDQILTLLNFEGEIGEDEIGAAAEFYEQWANMILTPQVLAQGGFYLGGAVVQTASDEI